MSIVHLPQARLLSHAVGAIGPWRVYLRMSVSWTSRPARMKRHAEHSAVVALRCQHSPDRHLLGSGVFGLPRASRSRCLRAGRRMRAARSAQGRAGNSALILTARTRGSICAVMGPMLFPDSLSSDQPRRLSQTDRGTSFLDRELGAVNRQADR
jgi:hypothetical protein